MYTSRYTPTDDDPTSHGSCVASKAGGTVFGVSKDTPLIIVKSSTLHGDIAWAWVKVRDDIRANPGRKAVVVFATGSVDVYTPGSTVKEPWSSIRTHMADIISMDGVIVVAAGNSRRGNDRKAVDIFPAVFESAQLPLIVAGAVDDTGRLAWFSQGPGHVSVWAPGVQIPCTRPSRQIQTGRGTSYSAGMVAGLAAYFLGFQNPPFGVGDGQTALNTRNFLHGLAWKRRLTGPKVIWNGQNGFKSDVWNISDISVPSNISIS